MTIKNMEFTCPKCGEVSSYAVQTNGEVTEQTGLTSHRNLGNLRSLAVPYKNSPNRDAYGPLVPQGIVVHYTQGRYEGAIGHFQNPASKVSAHFIVARDGRRVQMVPLPDPDTNGPRDGRYTAWHCKGGNTRYFGIEHEFGYTGATYPADWTEEMMDSSAELSAYMCALYGIPIEVPLAPNERDWFTGLGGHYNVPGNSHTDPGPYFPWDYYINRVEYFASRMADSGPTLTSGTPLQTAQGSEAPSYQTL
ncbi:N-acetylmuramoyl-L-alanine amidase [Streptomyces sp. SS]|uniref:N-acetylmuramoyl-L-alanine amidase n=1 Tax=Streptomyces sp. SS TaxID=260742 RepID=UPI00030E40B1|nr:peptidoglycan recognition family protein [Streptomyces sp. SS]